MYIGTHNNGNYSCFLLWSPSAQIFVPIPATLYYISLGFSLSLSGVPIQYFKNEEKTLGSMSCLIGFYLIIYHSVDYDRNYGNNP
jgi:hypothetical protein